MDQKIDDVKTPSQEQRPKEQQAEYLSPEDRAQLVREAEEIQKTISDAEAHLKEIEGSSESDQLKADEIQERLQATVGETGIGDIVLRERSMLKAVYILKKQDAETALAAILARLKQAATLSTAKAEALDA